MTRRCGLGLALVLAAAVAPAAAAPAAAPAPTALVFHDDPGGRPGLFLAAADGGGVRRLTDADDDPAGWTVDGRIAAVRTGAGAATSVVRVEPAGGRATVIAGPRFGCTVAPSPVAPVVLVQQAPLACKYAASFVLVGLDGSSRRVLDVGGPYAAARWAPDGRHVSVAVSSPFAAPWIGVVDAARATVRPVVAAGPAQRPAWSPDGGRLAYVRPAAADAPSELWVQQADGGDDHRLAAGVTSVGPSAWSPDGTRLAALAGPDLVAVDAVAGTTTALASLGDSAGEPAWSPDGRWIASVVSDGPAGGQVAFVATAAPHRRVDVRPPEGEAQDHAKTWSPDGGRLAFTVVDTSNPASQTRSLWLATPAGDVRRVSTGTHAGSPFFGTLVAPPPAVSAVASTTPTPTAAPPTTGGASTTVAESSPPTPLTDATPTTRTELAAAEGDGDGGSGGGALVVLGAAVAAAVAVAAGAVVVRRRRRA